MLELGKAESAGGGSREAPVLRDGVVVARLHASRWKDAATAVIGDRKWIFARAGRELTGREAGDPEGTVRLHARQSSAWKGTWTIDLEGTAVEMRIASRWKGTHRYLAGDGRPVADSGSIGTWSRRPTLTAEESMPLAHQVFLLWVELLIQRRAAGATAAAAAGGAAAAS